MKVHRTRQHWDNGDPHPAAGLRGRQHVRPPVPVDHQLLCLWESGRRWFAVDPPPRARGGGFQLVSSFFISLISTQLWNPSSFLNGADHIKSLSKLGVIHCFRSQNMVPKRGSWTQECVRRSLALRWVVGDRGTETPPLWLPGPNPTPASPKAKIAQFFFFWLDNSVNFNVTNSIFQ